MTVAPALVWFRQDLRLADNPALVAALEQSRPVVPVFVWSPEEEKPWAPGAASRWWLHQSLTALDTDLRRLGSRLIVRRGPTLEVLNALLAETGATAVHWNRRYEPASRTRDTQVKQDLKARGIVAESHNAALLFEPWEVRTKQDQPYRVYTPFWRACNALPTPPAPLRCPERLPPVPKKIPSLPIADLGLEPRIDWAGGMRAHWVPGEAGARKRLERMLRAALSAYGEDRNRPGHEGTSSLSPHLHFGEIGPRTIWHAVHGPGIAGQGEEVFLKELVWREFAYHLLYHFPETTDQPLRADFARFPWRTDPPALQAWQKGRTGYPFVDAGLRQLWATGWMHNRVRMVTGSFLVKHLLLPWQEGARWFWDTLVDADLASNTMGWQWVAGCGADAAPYFRIFNPVTQGERFDPQGDYVRQWVPELARLPAALLHKPWEADPQTLAEAGVVLGRTYPTPIVDHAPARARALEAFATIQAGSDPGES